jgi:hypothetical protein
MERVLVLLLMLVAAAAIAGLFILYGVARFVMFLSGGFIMLFVVNSIGYHQHKSSSLLHNKILDERFFRV